jgi:hypothetical protein
MMSAQQKQKVEENLCSSDEFFYLEEIMEKNGLTRQKVVLLKVPTGLLVKFMAFPGPEIDPIGLRCVSVSFSYMSASKLICKSY